MSSISSGNFAKIVLNPGETYRVATGGTATVEAIYGAPNGTTTVTANSVTFGPYGVNAKLKVTATSGPCDVFKVEKVPLEAYPDGSLDPAGAGAVLGAIARRTGFVESHSLLGTLSAAPANQGNTTFQTVISTEQPFTQVRVGFINRETTAQTIDAFSVGASDALNLSGGPSLAGSAAAMVAGSLNGSASITLPAATENTSETVTFSDWIDRASVAWTGYPGKYLLHVQAFVAATSGCTWSTQTGTGAYTAFPNAAGSRIRDVGYRGNAQGNVIGSYAKSNGSVGLPMVIETRTVTGVKTVRCMLVGDSTQAANQNPLGADMNNWLYKACSLANDEATTIKFSALNFGWGGQTTKQFNTRLAKVFASFRPDHLFYAPYSVNDGATTQVEVDRMLARMYSVIDLCQQHGVALTLVTPCPSNAITLAQDNLRKGAITTIKAAAAALKLGLVDHDAVLSDGASPAQFISGTNADAQHPNDTGVALQAAAGFPALRLYYV